MHHSRQPIDISLVVDDDNDEELSNHHYVPSSVGDYSSLIVDSPPDTMCQQHMYNDRSPSPMSSHIQTSQTSSSPSSVRQSRRRYSHSSSAIDSTSSGTNIYRDRIRFSSWPRHRREKRDILAEHDKRLAKSIIQELGIGINKTYRNPWGNLSYAQLITRAIDSSPWKRLTLNEVYEWIIKFVPYFKDKIDAKTSWGWKNSIRHNLSLHNQFIRVPVISSLSKGPVKYVWTINPSFKNNSPYKKYSLKRKRAAAAAAAAAAAVSNLNSTSNLSQNSEQNLESNSVHSSSNNYHRHSINSLPKATRLSEQSHGNGSSGTLNQLSVAAAMMSAGVTDPAAYRAFLNTQAATAAMMNKHKQQTNSSISNTQQTTPIAHRHNSSAYTHESGLPIPKKLALSTDRYKQQQQQHQHQQQQQQQQHQQHAEWLLNSYRQQSQSYNGNRHPHSSGTNKIMVNQQRSTYLPPTAQSLNSRVNSDINSLSSSLQRRGSSPPSYSSAAAAAAAAAQNKLLAQTKFWHAVQAAAQQQQQQQQQQYHQQGQPNSINELQNYMSQSNSNNGSHNKMSSYLNPEALKLLTTNNSHDEQHHFTNDPRFKQMRASYPNSTNSSIPSACLIRQRPNQANGSASFNSQQQMDALTAAYHNYRRRSSGFSSTTSHGGASDDESDEYIPPRKDSSTSNASSGYESCIPPSRQSPPDISNIRTGSGSSITSEASSSSYYKHSKNGTSHIIKRFAKINSNDTDLDLDDRQQLTLNNVGGYVDGLMERIRKMPPKKRSKFYQMLDEERLKDLNNNDETKMKSDDLDDDHHGHVSMDVPVPLIVTEVDSDDEEDRTLIELSSDSQPTNDDEERKYHQQIFGLNEKAYDELISMGVPLAVLKAIAFQHQQQTQTNSSLTNKCTVSATNSSADDKRLLNARTILRKILQEHQKEQRQHSTNDKSLPEPMDYTTDEESGVIEDDADIEHRSSSSSSTAPVGTIRHRNGNRSNSHNPGNGVLNSNDISSLSPPTSTSSSPDEVDVNHETNPNSFSRPSSTPATLVTSTCSY